MENNGLANSKKEVYIHFTFGEKEHISFNASKKLLPGIETIGKLGHQEAKIWIQNHNTPAVLTAPNVNRAALNAPYKTEIVLVMPIAQGENMNEFKQHTALGSLHVDLENGKTWFKGGEGKTLNFEVKPAVTLNKESDILKRKRMLALKQEQEIRILELEKS